MGRPSGRTIFLKGQPRLLQEFLGGLFAESTNSLLDVMVNWNTMQLGMALDRDAM